MIHYKHIPGEDRKEIFFKQPENFNRFTEKKLLSKALGATLYMPSIRGNIAKEIIDRKHISLTSIVIDLEDAISDNQVEEGEKNLIAQLKEIEKAVKDEIISENDIPILFVRVRNPEHLKKLLLHGKDLSMLSGFVFPKFNSVHADIYIETLVSANEKLGTKFYAMPILESNSLIYKENRMTELVHIYNVLKKHSDIILNVRMGGTDFCGLYSIRRSMDTTIYDVVVVKDCITDILNMFNRAEDDFVVSGVVWEFFSNHNRILKPELRQTPFEHKGNTGKKERMVILEKAIDGLIKEVVLDKVNGIVGKTIIHPSHITYVNAFEAVNREEYEDALSIVESSNQGVLKSNSGNKMNEIKPHLNWALNVLDKAKIYGVLNHEKTCHFLF